MIFQFVCEITKNVENSKTFATFFLSYRMYFVFLYVEIGGVRLYYVSCFNPPFIYLKQIL